MPTINSIARQASMVASLSTKFFGTDFEAGRNSLLVGSAFNTLNNQVKSDFGGQPALTNMIENYQARREAFSRELNDNMQSLKDSSDRLKESTGTEETAAEDTTADTDNDQNTGSTLSNLSGFANGNIPPQNRIMVAPANNNVEIPPPPPENDAEDLTDEEVRETMRNNFQEATRNGFEEFAERYLVAETAENSDLTALEEVSQRVSTNRGSGEDIIANVRNLINDYNSARNYINENRGLSSRMSALADNFGSNRELAQSLTSIGIFMDANGDLSINETILQLELDRDADNVNSILGSDGLAGQMDREVERANSQSENLFPSIYDYSSNNQQDITESLYSRQNFNAASYAWENVSRFFTMLT